jgi:hypothetical protein
MEPGSSRRFQNHRDTYRVRAPLYAFAEILFLVVLKPNCASLVAISHARSGDFASKVNRSGPHAMILIPALRQNSLASSSHEGFSLLAPANVATRKV